MNRPGNFSAWLLAVAVSALTLLAACDQVAQNKLQPGVSTVDDVSRFMGKPDRIRDGENGEKLYEFARQPEGYENYVVRIGPDDKLIEIKQLLTEANFGRVKPGMTKPEVRDLLGRPMKQQMYQLKQEEVWSWRFRSGPNDSMLFDVSFDTDGKVKEVGRSPDPRTQAG